MSFGNSRRYCFTICFIESCQYLTGHSSPSMTTLRQEDGRDTSSCNRESANWSRTSRETHWQENFEDAGALFFQTRLFELLSSDCTVSSLCWNAVTVAPSNSSHSTNSLHWLEQIRVQDHLKDKAYLHLIWRSLRLRQKANKTRKEIALAKNNRVRLKPAEQNTVHALCSRLLSLMPLCNSSTCCWLTALSKKCYWYCNIHWWYLLPYTSSSVFMLENWTRFTWTKMPSDTIYKLKPTIFIDFPWFCCLDSTVTNKKLPLF